MHEASATKLVFHEHAGGCASGLGLEAIQASYWLRVTSVSETSRTTAGIAW